MRLTTNPDLVPTPPSTQRTRRGRATQRWQHRRAFGASVRACLCMRNLGEGDKLGGRARQKIQGPTAVCPLSAVELMRRRVLGHLFFFGIDYTPKGGCESHEEKQGQRAPIGRRVRPRPCSPPARPELTLRVLDPGLGPGQIHDKHLTEMEDEGRCAGGDCEAVLRWEEGARGKVGPRGGELARPCPGRWIGRHTGS